MIWTRIFRGGCKWAGFKMGLALAAQHLGTGDRPGVMIHCTLTHGGVMKGLAAALPGHRWLAPDLPSHGQSADWPPGAPGLQRVSSEGVAALMDGPADVVGHSFGATVALRLAVLRPDLVRSLVLIEPVYGAVARIDAPDVAAIHEVQALPMMQAILRGEMDLAAQLFTRDWGLGRPWDGLPEPARARMAAQMPFVASSSAEIYDDSAGLLLSGALTALKIPVLVLEGGDTAARHPVMRVICKGLAARIPGARHALIDGAGHMAPLTHPDATAALIRDHLAVATA